MTLSDQINLVEQLVRKEPETTIKEYLELVADLDRIERIFEKQTICHSEDTQRPITVQLKNCGTRA
jgi:hypothetical protein